MSSPTVSVIGLPASMRLDEPELATVGLDQVGPARAGCACGRPDHPRPARPGRLPHRAAATATSTSATPPSATSVIGWPVAGFSVTNRRPSTAWRKSPPMNSSVRRRSPATSAPRTRGRGDQGVGHRGLRSRDSHGIIGRGLRLRADQTALRVELLEQIVGGELDVLVAPLGRPVDAGDQAGPVDPPEVAEHEGVAGLRLVGGPDGQPEVPRRVLVP